MANISNNTGWELIKSRLASKKMKWFVSGAAGFIGSHLVETLLKLDQVVVGIDNFITGSRQNLIAVERAVSPEAWKAFTFIEGDIQNSALYEGVLPEVDVVLHQAALGSVPRSIADPWASHDHNVNGFLAILAASKGAEIPRFVYASSSSVYGDHPELPKVEDKVGRPLSPYAATKKINEIYADVFFKAYGLRSIGLRYFNVFGPRQDPNGPYAAVIPRWINALATGKEVEIYGDGKTTRDFCFVDNAVQANLLAGLSSEDATNKVYNVAFHEQTSLLELQSQLVQLIQKRGFDIKNPTPVYRPERKGDIRHSLADISLGQRLLKYRPDYNVTAGLDITVEYFLKVSL